MGLNGPNYLKLDQKCIKFPQKVSKIIEWGLLSYKVVSHKKRVEFASHRQLNNEKLKGSCGKTTK